MFQILNIEVVFFSMYLKIKPENGGFFCLLLQKNLLFYSNIARNKSHFSGWEAYFDSKKLPFVCFNLEKQEETFILSRVNFFKMQSTKEEFRFTKTSAQIQMWQTSLENFTTG